MEVFCVLCGSSDSARKISSFEGKIMGRQNKKAITINYLQWLLRSL
jgi:hypothetical protein